MIENGISEVHVDLTRQEYAWILNNPERCPSCGHLLVFHYIDYLEHGGYDHKCLVGSCSCIA